MRVRADRLADLRLDGEDRIERRHRLLEDQADTRAADRAQLVLGESDEVCGRRSGSRRPRLAREAGPARGSRAPSGSCPSRTPPPDRRSPRARRRSSRRARLRTARLAGKADLQSGDLEQRRGPATATDTDAEDASTAASGSALQRRSPPAGAPRCRPVGTLRGGPEAAARAASARSARRRSRWRRACVPVAADVGRAGDVEMRPLRHRRRRTARGRPPRWRLRPSARRSS